MYEILNSFKQKPITKVQQKLINFEKPQNLGFKTWNACKWEKRNLPSEEKNLKKLEEHLGMTFGVREREFWEVKRQVCRERDREKWVGNCDSRLNRSPVSLDK